MRLFDELYLVLRGFSQQPNHARIKCDCNHCTIIRRAIAVVEEIERAPYAETEPGWVLLSRLTPWRDRLKEMVK